MRKVVAIEGKKTIDGRLLLPGSLESADRAFIPVMVLAGEAIIGTARDFERNEETGELSYEIKLLDRHYREDLERMNFHLFISPFESEMREDGTMAVISGLIRSVSLSEGDWAWSTDVRS